MAKYLAILFIFVASASAQFTSTARHIGNGATLPPTCNPNTGDVFFKTSATIGAYQCLSANTWTLFGTGSVSSVTPTKTTVTYSATPTFTVASHIQEFEVTLTGNVNSSTLSGAASGDFITFRIIQDGTGSRTFAWPTGFSNACTISPTASVETKQIFYWDGTTAVPQGPCTSTDTATFMMGPTRSAPGSNPPASNLFSWFDSTSNTQEWSDSSGNITTAVKHSSLPWLCVCSSSGGGLAYVGTPTLFDGTAIPAALLAAPVQGQEMTLIPDVANAGSFTIQIDGATAKGTRTISGATFSAANTTTASRPYTFSYGPTNRWYLKGPGSIPSSPNGTLTFGGTTFVPTGDLVVPVISTNGGSGADLSAAAAHSTVISNGASPAVYSAKVIPDCTDTGGNHINFTQSTDAFSCGTSGGSGGGTGSSITSTTPVTATANSTSEQTLMELTLGAGYFNTLGQPFLFNAAGVFSTPVAQTPTITLKTKLCTVSGCGSGTVVTLISIITTATLASSTNNNWNFSFLGYTQTVGASGKLEIHGPLSIDLGALSTSADSIFNDTNTAASSAIDLTGTLFVDFTVTFSTGSASNACTQRAGGIMPFAAAAAPTITIVDDISVMAGPYNNGTGSATLQNFDIDSTATAPALGTIVGTQTYTVITMNNVGTPTIYHRRFLPSTWTGAIDVAIWWVDESVGSGNVKFTAALACAAAGSGAYGYAGGNGPLTFNTASNVTTASGAAGVQPFRSVMTSLSTTNCAANAYIAVKITRDNTVGSNMGNNARLIGITLTIRRTNQ